MEKKIEVKKVITAGVYGTFRAPYFALYNQETADAIAKEGTELLKEITKKINDYETRMD